MKKTILLSVMLVTLNSCYVHKTVVGEGSQSGAVESKKQHNFVYGLASGKTPDTQEMAKGAKDYEVITSHSFVDGLINGLTFGLYNPTTVKVKR